LTPLLQAADFLRYSQIFRLAFEDFHLDTVEHCFRDFLALSMCL